MSAVLFYVLYVQHWHIFSGMHFNVYWEPYAIAYFSHDHVFKLNNKWKLKMKKCIGWGSLTFNCLIFTVNLSLFVKWKVSLFFMFYCTRRINDVWMRLIPVTRQLRTNLEFFLFFAIALLWEQISLTFMSLFVFFYVSRSVQFFLLCFFNGSFYSLVVGFLFDKLHSFCE